MHPTIWKLGYGAGHLLNDVCASVWFSYTLLVYQRVFLFPNDLVGIVILVGQVADGLGTIFVGFMADREMTCCLRKYGKRKIWHMIGTALTVCTFPLMFSPCLGCEDSSRIVQLFYYLTMVVVFQLGWAAVQISHLSLIPVLAKTPKSRTDLNAIRYAFTVSGNIFVYLVALIVLFGFGKDGESTEEEHPHLGTSRSTIGPDDAAGFQVIVGSTMAVGILAVVLFHAITSEPVEPPQEPCKSAVEYQREKDTLRAWMTSADFWVLCVIYMCTRLYVNLSTSYIALYMNDYMMASKTKVTAIPLVLYAGGFLGSVCLKKINLFLGKRWSLAVGALLGCAAAAAVYLGSGRLYADYLVYAAVTLLGVAGSLLLVTTLALTSDMIADSARAAFVYGALSFGDKLSGGLVVAGIQRFLICKRATSECGDVYRYILVVSCGATSLVILIMTLVYGSPYLWKRNQKKVKKLSTSRSVDIDGIQTISNYIISTDNEKNYSIHAGKLYRRPSTASHSTQTTSVCQNEPAIDHPLPHQANRNLRELQEPLYRSIMDQQANKGAANPLLPLMLEFTRSASFSGPIVDDKVPIVSLRKRVSVAGQVYRELKSTAGIRNSLFAVEKDHSSPNAEGFLSSSSRASSQQASTAARNRSRSSSIMSGVIGSAQLAAPQSTTEHEIHLVDYDVERFQ